MTTNAPQSKSRFGKTILYVIGSLDLGGSERHLALIAPRLKRLGWDPVIYCLSRKGYQAMRVAEAGIRVIGPPYEVTPNRGFGRIMRMGLSVLKLAWTMIWVRPGIVHFFLPMAYLVGAPIALLTGVPIRILSRRSLNRYQDGHPFVSRVERRLHRHMTMVLGNSERVVRELIETEDCPPIVSNSSTTALTSAPSRQPLPRPWQKERARARRELVLVMVANLIPYKGHADLLRALAASADRLPSAVVPARCRP